jgi:hypothetical protein
MVFVNTEIFSQRHEACRNYLAARQLKESFAFSNRETEKERGDCEAWLELSYYNLGGEGAGSRQDY